MDLVADIGATNTRCALLDDNGHVLSPEIFENAEFTSLEGLLRVYLDHRRANEHPQHAALAVAAPIHSDNVKLINIDWRFSQTGLKQAFDLNRLLVVNDFVAIAWALPMLRSADYKQLGTGEPVARSPKVVIGPGSGLGVASLVPSADSWTAVASEGGHVTLPASTKNEAAALKLIREQTGHCSAERVLSGPGLARLYVALAELAGRDGASVTAADVTNLAKRGEPLARETLDMFFALLGTVAADLALTLGARGGVYIAGGIVPKFIDTFEASGFRARFEAKGRYRQYMQTVPTFVVTESLPAFRGLRSLLGYR